MLKTTGRLDEPEFVWVHSGPVDHDPVLAPAAEPPRLYCDFCSAPDPEWVIDTPPGLPDRPGNGGGSLTENFTGGGRLRPVRKSGPRRSAANAARPGRGQHSLRQSCRARLLPGAGRADPRRVLCLWPAPAAAHGSRGMMGRQSGGKATAPLGKASQIRP